MGRLLLFLVCLGVIILGVFYLTQDETENTNTKDFTEEKVENGLFETETEDTHETERSVPEEKNECLLTLNKLENEIIELEQAINNGEKLNVTAEYEKYAVRVKSAQQAMIDKGCNTDLDYSLIFADLVKKYAALMSKVHSQTKS